MSRGETESLGQPDAVRRRQHTLYDFEPFCDPANHELGEFATDDD